MRLRSSLLLLSVVAGLTQASCVDNQLSLVISRFVLVEQSSNCQADPSITTIVSNGLLDVGITEKGYPGYIAAPVIENRLLTMGTTAMVEVNNIQVTGVEVELQPGAGLDPLIPASSRKFFVPAAGGFLKPAGGSVALLIEVIPRALGVQLAAQLPAGGLPERVMAKIRPVGKHAGQDIDGGAINLPIDICKFCLTTPPQACPAGGVPESQRVLGSCNPSQDKAVTCCGLDGGYTVCGEDVPLMTSGG